MFTSSHNAKGFTLIELVVVIVVLGILSAVALPRFTDLSREARASQILAGAGAIRAAAALVNTKVIVSGMPIDGTLRQVDIGGGNLIDVQNGYPACTLNGIVKAAGTSSDYIWYLGGSGLCSLYPNRGNDAGGHIIYMNTCGVVYQNSTGTTWDAVTSGC